MFIHIEAKPVYRCINSVLTSDLRVGQVNKTMKPLLTITLFALFPSSAFATEVDVVEIIGIFFFLPLFIIIIIITSANNRSKDLKLKKSDKTDSAAKDA